MQPVSGATVWTKSTGAIGDELDLQIPAAHPFEAVPSPTGKALVLATAVTTPVSVGSVRLTSRDPRAAPRIDYNLLAEGRDRRRIVEGVKLCRRIARTAPLADLVDHEMSPGTDVVSDEALEAAIAASLDTYHHGCSMGGEDDRSAVVDAAGRVRHVQGLRVIDASIFPEIPAEPINLTTIMLAEHIAASMIRSDRR